MDHQTSTSPARRVHSRSFSMRSDKSSERNSQPAPPTPGEKAEKIRRDSFMRGESKANPNAAINEAQPQGTSRSIIQTIFAMRL